MFTPILPADPVMAPAPRWRAPDLSGAVELSRRVALPLPPGAVWEVLRRVETVVSCVPGATLAALEGDEAEASLAVSIGPMRAIFRGRARVAYDDAAQSGLLTGNAQDAATRSSAAGSLAFRVVPDGARCTVAADIRYRLSGPLAQAGRPAVVADVVDRLLDRFTANLVAAATDRPMDARPIGGLRLALGLVFSALRRWVGGG